MKFQIIGDSSLDLNEHLSNWLDVKFAPFMLTVGGTTYIDDENLEYQRLLDDIDKSPEVAKSAAPSPYDYLKLIDPSADGVFIITISSKLSASYNSALIAKEMAQDEYPGIKIHVIDSKRASCGETILAVEIKRKEEEGLSFEETVEYIDKFSDESILYFLLDNLDTLVKNGRMSYLAGKVAQLLHIKPILTATPEGEIGLADKARTSPKALDKLAEYVYSVAKDTRDTFLIISHCQAEAKAQILKAKIEVHKAFKEIIIVPMKGLSSTYANVGGLICAL